MDLTFSSAEQSLIDQVGAAISARSDPGALDRVHWAAIEEAGLGEAAGGKTGLIGAALAVSEAARLGSLTPFATRAIVLPLFGGAGGGLAAIEDSGSPAAPARYGAEAQFVVSFEGDRALLRRVDPAKAEATPANYVYPLGTPASSGPALATAPTAQVQSRQRLALSAEAVGAMDSLLQAICAYVTRRRQFGQPLGSLQGVQHRLAEMAIDLEMARWLVRQAAWDDEGASAAVAAAFVARRARRFAWDVHQLAGARGFTLDMGLSFDTLRLQALSVEAGGAKAHEAAGVALTWP